MTCENNQNACRHFLGTRPGQKQCAMGRDVRAWAIRCNGGSRLGIGLRLPCARQDEGAEKPLFDCPELDRRSDEEVAEIEARRKAAIDRTIMAQDVFYKTKEGMIENGEGRRDMPCPLCGNGLMRVYVAIDYNNHMTARCDICGEGFME